MHKNPYWLLLLALVSLGVVGYTAKTGYQMFRYAIHQVEINPQEIVWKAILRDGDFFVTARYQYDYKGKKIESSYEFPEKYLNRWVAEDRIALYQKEGWKGWVNPFQPLDSALQKNFPLKECISTLILWGILGYFLWIGYYVTSYARNHT